MRDMNRKISAGVLWNLAGLFMKNGASTVFTLFLAKLLAPESFGLIAMITIVFQVATVIVQSGLGQSLIRSESVSQTDLNTVFYTNMVMAGLVYAAIFFSAPWVAHFYEQPVLVELLRVTALVVVFNAAKMVQVAVLVRAMDFKAQMKANTTGVLLSGTAAVAAAYAGFGVWSLALQIVASAVVSTLILWIASTWRPSWSFSIRSFRHHFSFGVNLLAEGLLEVVFQNSYVLVIGRFFSAEMAGLYYFARRISDLISQQFTGAVQQATYPALATLQNETENLKAKYREIIQVTMAIISPIMFLIAALSEPVVSLLFGEKWLGAVPYIQVLSWVAVLYPLHALNVNALKVKNRSDLVLKVGFVKKAVSLSILVASIPYGVLGIVVGQAVASTLALLPNTYFCRRLVNYSLMEQMADISKPMFSAAIAAMSAWLVVRYMEAHDFMVLLVSGLIGLFLYIVISLAVRSVGALTILAQVKRRLL